MYSILMCYHEQNANMSMGYETGLSTRMKCALLMLQRVSSAGEAARPDDTALAFCAPAGGTTLTVTRGNGLISAVLSFGGNWGFGKAAVNEPGGKTMKIATTTASVREEQWHALRYIGVN